MSTFREAQIQVSWRTLWALKAICRATNSAKPKELLTDPSESVDKLAERILSQWITAHHPALDAIYLRREQLDEEATKAAGGQTGVPF